MAFTLNTAWASLPPASCYPPTLDQAGQIIANHLLITGLDALNTFNYGPTTPSADLQDRPWIKTDAQYKLIGLYTFTGGSWQPAAPAILPGTITDFFGAAGSIVAPFYQCLRGDTIVTMADGTGKTIQDLVDSKSEEEVLSYDLENKRITKSRIYDWFVSASEKVDYRWIQSKKWDNQTRTIYATKNHPFWTDRGWVKAGDLTENDRTYKARPQLTAWGKQAILGMYLGDACIRSETLLCQVNHGLPQKDYANFTASKFNVNANEYVQKKSNIGYNSGFPFLTYTVALNILWPEIKSLLHPEKISFELLNQIGLVGLAHWYMDDGSMEKDIRYPEYAKANFHTQGFSKESRDIIAQWFKETYGFDVSQYACSNTLGKKITLSQDSSSIFFALIAPYIHPSLRYKLPSKYADIPFILSDMDFIGLNISPNKCDFKEISELRPDKKNSKKFYKRYDIGVENTHCFFANGFLVHNCNGQVVNGPIGGSLTTPNLSGLVTVGTGTNPSTGTIFAQGATGGEEKHVLTQPELPNVNLQITGNPQLIVGASSPSAIQGSGDIGRLSNATIPLGGTNTGHNNLQPYMALYKIIFWP